MASNVHDAIPFKKKVVNVNTNTNNNINIENSYDNNHNDYIINSNVIEMIANTSIKCSSTNFRKGMLDSGANINIATHVFSIWICELFNILQYQKVRIIERLQLLIKKVVLLKYIDGFIWVDLLDLWQW